MPRATSGNCLKLATLVTIMICGCSSVRADPSLSLQFGSEKATTSNNLQIMIMPHQIAGTNWEVSAGMLVLTVVPGPNAGSDLSATLTLTGVDADHPFVISYDGNNPGNINNVSISFSASGFDVLDKPVPETASLDGSIVTFDPLATGLELKGRANGVQFTDVKPTNAKGPGAFNGNDTENTTFNDVSSISGTLTFAWDPVQNVASDHINFPHSADLAVYGTGAPLPEPTTIVLATIGFITALARGTRQASMRMTKPTKTRR